jgi:hypothetical protein
VVVVSDVSVVVVDRVNSDVSVVVVGTARSVVCVVVVVTNDVGGGPGVGRGLAEHDVA